MHSLAWDDPEDEKGAPKTIAKGEPGQVIDLPTPPDHIIVDIKPRPNIYNDLNISIYHQIQMSFIYQLD